MVVILFLSGAKFEKHCSSILEIFLIQYFTVLVEQFDVIAFLICIIQKRKMKEDIPKRKTNKQHFNLII